MSHWTRCLLLVPLLLACGGGSSSSLASAPSTPTGDGVVESGDGVSIAYEVLGAGEPALVFVHCWACNRSFWREQAQVFAADHTVVLLDLPGHGESGNDRVEWTLDAYGADVAAVVEHLGLQRVVLVGHSMGGPVSLLAAPQLGDRLEGVVCVDTLHDAEFAWPEDAMTQWSASLREDYEASMQMGVAGMAGSDEALQQWILDEALQADREAMIELTGAFASFDLAAALAATEAPIRCVNAAPYNEMSMVTAVETNQRYADFDAVLMEGVGHYLQLERPDELNDKMRELLDEIAPSR